MSNELKWSEKFLVRVDGLKVFEISLFPANIWQYLKFLFFRQSYQNAIRKVALRNVNGIELVPEVADSKFGLYVQKQKKFYLMKNGEYTIECRIDEKCEGWNLKYKIKGVSN